MKSKVVVPKGILWPFILLTTLFFAWAVPNNLTDTMLAAFKRIMSLSDSKTAWIQVVCYLLGYGCFAVPGAIFICKHSYKSGVMLGLGLYATGAFLFFPAMKVAMVSNAVGYITFLLAILVLFAGLSILETSANSYVCAIGPEETATRRLNLAQSFNPFGAIAGVVLSQMFILSKLNTMSAAQRQALSAEELQAIQGGELTAVTTAYVILGAIMVVLLVAIALTRMPSLKENGDLDLKGSGKRLLNNKRYVWSVVAQFFNIGAQIAVWSYIIRYAMHNMHFDSIIASLGPDASQGEIIGALRGVEPVAGGFYSVCDFLGLDALLPRTAEQAGATYYIMSLILFVVMRFVCTWLMKYVQPRRLLTVLAAAAVAFSLGTVFGKGAAGVYCLMCISGCMSLMFPTIYGMGIDGLGEDTKLGGSGMVMAIAGASVLTQIEGIISDQVGSIATAYIVPAIAFAVIFIYASFIMRSKAVDGRIRTETR
ncbi:MAG: L-fucose:H+ symporter permease [Bacteroidales bacterium]|nr:L-fucose:H+ symporter permease [Bacteroidales bacterium]MBQ6184744.1 L-fucose:H+ symporter permease [Bacteroidales bacterium]